MIDLVPQPTVITPPRGRVINKPENCPFAVCSALSLYQAEVETRKATEVRLRRFVLRERALLRQKSALIRQNELLSRESEHRLLNGLQLISSLLSVQSRETKNVEAASLLAVAANRVEAIGRVHRHLHTLDNVKTVEFHQYLISLCSDLSKMASDKSAASVVTVKGVELYLPSATGIPLGFIASELITNALKYAKGKVSVTLEKTGSDYSLSVSDDGPGLQEEFNPAATRGLGMKIISTLVRQIGGHLLFAKGDTGHGTKFTVVASHS